MEMESKDGKKSGKIEERILYKSLVYYLIMIQRKFKNKNFKV